MNVLTDFKSISTGVKIQGATFQAAFTHFKYVLRLGAIINPILHLALETIEVKMSVERLELNFFRTDSYRHLAVGRVAMSVVQRGHRDLSNLGFK